MRDVRTRFHMVFQISFDKNLKIFVIEKNQNYSKPL